MNFIAYEGHGFLHLWCMTPAQTSSLRYSEGSGLNSSDPVLRSDWRCRFQGLIRTRSELTPAASHLYETLGWKQVHLQGDEVILQDSECCISGLFRWVCRCCR